MNNSLGRVAIIAALLFCSITSTVISATDDTAQAPVVSSDTAAPGTDTPTPSTDTPTPSSDDVTKNDVESTNSDESSNTSTEAQNNPDINLSACKPQDCAACALECVAKSDVEDPNDEKQLDEAYNTCTQGDCKQECAGCED
jgi:hypothetical protein